MSVLSQSQIEEALRADVDPYLGQDLVSAKCIQAMEVEGDRVRVLVSLGFPAAGYVEELTARLKDIIEAIDGVAEANIEVSTTITAHSAQQGVPHLKGVKNIIAVASGKGGVGKSTTSVNLALALAAEGAKVGLLDADIYGPSQPRMLGAAETRPETKDGQRMEPVISHGIQSMSIGYLVDEDSAMIWRGPMVTQALQQLLNETNWHELDYLIIDLPPGTGDIQLTLSQKVPVSGALIVTTPQDIALLDARKAYKMFEKVSVPVLGVIENMSTHICSQCGHQEHIFGEGGGQRMAEQYGVDFLGALPLDIRIRQEVDSGNPTVIAEPEGAIARTYREIARKTTAKLSMQAKDYSSVFPKIVVQNN